MDDNDSFSGQEDICIELIGQEQRAQIDALKTEIESLKDQLKEKQNYIEILEHRDTTVEDTIKETLSHLSEGRDENTKARIQDLLDSNNPAEQIRAIASITSPSEVDSSVVQRLCTYLRGHVDFLTRLSETPELQSLFLVSEGTGEIFLNETSRRLLLEQAARTSKYLANYDSQHDDTPIQTVSDILDLKLDNTRRIEDIKKFIGGEELKSDELKALLLQEIMISSALRRYAERLSQTTKPQTPSRTSQETLSSDLSEVVSLLCQAVDDPMKTPDMKNLLQLARRTAEDLITIKTAAGVPSTEICALIDDLHHRTAEMEHQMNQARTIIAKHNQTINSLKRQIGGDWNSWAKRLYTALINTCGDSATTEDMRIAIEEAALTSIGSFRSYYNHRQ